MLVSCMMPSVACSTVFLHKNQDALKIISNAVYVCSVIALSKGLLWSKGRKHLKQSDMTEHSYFPMADATFPCIFHIHALTE